MKYFLRVLLVLVLAGAVVFGVYYHLNGQSLPNGAQELKLTTVTKPPATEKNAQRILLCELEEEDYRLYQTENAVLLTHGDKEFEFNINNSFMTREAPQMFCFNIDEDETDKEIIVRAASGEELSTGEFIYDIYIFKNTGDSEENYLLVSAARSTWENVMSTQIKEELSQLKSCSKFLQFAMAVAGSNISYDKTTGIVTGGSGFVGYARALQDENGNYMTANGWNRGKGIYKVSEDGVLSAEIEILVGYKESTAKQKIGTIQFDFYLSSENRLTVTPKSLVFRADSAYRISNPRKTATKSWRYGINNASGTQQGSIRLLQYHAVPEPSTLTQTVNMDDSGSDINKVASLVITESAVQLTAKDGCRFNSEAAQTGMFSVIINKGTEDEYEIAYNAVLNETGTVLKINFDKTYDEDELQSIDISYGAK